MKSLKVTLLILLLLIVIGIVALPALIKSWVTAESFVRQIEAEFNCRASIDSIEIVIFKRPSKIILKGLALGPRDEFAVAEVPLGERPPMNEMVSHCESIHLELQLGSLLTRQLNVQEFAVKNLNIQTILRKDGSNSLDDLFQSHEDANEKESSQVEKTGTDKEVKDTQPGGGEPLNARDLPLSMIADRLAIEGGSIFAQVEATGATIVVDDIRAEATEIDLNPGDLVNHNRMLIGLSMLVGVDSPQDKGVRYAEFRFDGTAAAAVFDPGSGDLDPSLLADLVIAEGSYIDANPTLEAVADLLKGLEEYGIDIGEVNLRGEFKEPVETRLEWAGGVLRILKETIFNVGDYSLVLAPESWLDANKDQHEFQGAVIASEERTQKAIVEVDEWLESKVSVLANPSVRNTLLAPVMEDGRIRLGFRSSGEMGDPKVDLVTRLGSISDVLSLKDSESLEQLKTQGKQLLEGLKGLFRSNPEPAPAEPPAGSPPEPASSEAPRSEPAEP